jgi:hypothetical protein
MHALRRPWYSQGWARFVVLLTVLLLVLVFVAACGGSSSGESPQDKESKSNQNSYAQLVAQQPGHTMAYSPTRSTINFYIDKWGKTPGKLSYVYLQNSSGRIIGYYVFKGLPVTMCAALKPTQKAQWWSDSNGGSPILIPQPSADGVYYSGGQCNEYYGEDATTGAFVDYTIGLGINVLLYDQPLPPQQVGNAPHLGPTSTADVQKK